MTLALCVLWLVPLLVPFVLFLCKSKKHDPVHYPNKRQQETCRPGPSQGGQESQDYDTLGPRPDTNTALQQTQARPRTEVGPVDAYGTLGQSNRTEGVPKMKVTKLVQPEKGKADPLDDAYATIPRIAAPMPESEEQAKAQGSTPPRQAPSTRTVQSKRVQPPQGNYGTIGQPLEDNYGTIGAEAAQVRAGTQPRDLYQYKEPGSTERPDVAQTGRPLGLCNIDLCQTQVRQTEMRGGTTYGETQPGFPAPPPIITRPSVNDRTTTKPRDTTRRPDKATDRKGWDALLKQLPPATLIRPDAAKADAYDPNYGTLAEVQRMPEQN